MLRAMDTETSQHVLPDLVCSVCDAGYHSETPRLG
jgi:hypothetical protein